MAEFDPYSYAAKPADAEEAFDPNKLGGQISEDTSQTNQQPGLQVGNLPIPPTMPQHNIPIVPPIDPFMPTLQIGKDIVGSALNFVRNIPSYYEKARIAVPGAYEEIKQNPMQVLKQFGAGIAEQGQNVFNMPHDIANYATNRLNILPQEWNEAIQMGRMPEDTESLINQQFGTAQSPGQELIRGVGRNALNIAGFTPVARAINPLNFTYKGIAGGIINSLNEMKNKYSGPNGLYTNLFNEARQRGMGTLSNLNPSTLANDYSIMSKAANPKYLSALENLVQNPLIEHAKDTVSDMKQFIRKMNAKDTLLDPESKALNAANRIKDNIEQNMFKDSQGNIHQDLADKYKQIDHGYAIENIPYTKNPHIKKYLNNEMSEKELVNKLNKGKFARQRGAYHPSMTVRNAINLLNPLSWIKR